jgi:hypothetical protein
MCISQGDTNNIHYLFLHGTESTGLVRKYKPQRPDHLGLCLFFISQPKIHYSITVFRMSIDIDGVTPS